MTNNKVLVIGAGIAGMEASLMLAKAGKKVYLVEKNSYIGGNIIKYEDVFSNLECATFMIAPVQQEILENKNIEVLTLSEVIKVQGSYGDFSVKIKKKARYVSIQDCIGCNACFGPCPVSLENEFEEGLNQRKAIYIPCAGALPNVPRIDPENCIRFKGQACNACKEACMFEAIDYDGKDQELEINVESIIIATGVAPLNPEKIPKYGYGLDDIYSALEFEIMNAGGNIVFKNKKPPESVAIVHCVGREEIGYCSKICCSYSSKFIKYLKDKIPAIKIHEIYYNLCTLKYKKERCNTNLIRVLDITIIEKNGIKTIDYQIEDGKKNSIQADMVILLPAIEPSADAPELAEMLNISLDEKAFFAEKHVKLEPVSSSTEGIFIAGCAGGPKDIYDSVIQSEAVSGEILSSLVPGRKLEPEVKTSQVYEVFCTGCKTCLSVCSYSAISYDELKGICKVNEVLCRGCGNCASACPSDAITHKHFTSRQIFQELIEILK